ncbi:Mycophenolic acid synthesis protein B [Colletotrichum trifolii]|uniref:Mycophenolic acid synthesis protein B n=1 Tax=Colletotrichum trifolii TaxID=5466 RepID=A0A4R8RKS8_COLTR|nr:Mycophenolic acid synthesis protein B [Colletotrichum trifolii]
MFYVPILAVFTAHLLLVRFLRYRRRDDIQRRYPYKTREEMASMSLSDAAAIMRELSDREFPTIFYSSVSFALFKTYGIPTISKLLVATSQLSGDATASKRRTDTGVLMTEIIFNDPASRRNISAVARVNFLHDGWRRAGKISNDDMLYTLSLFALEPVRWTAKYEWRDLTVIEKTAMAVFWKDLGREMLVDYDRLVPHMGGKDDPLAWLEALQVWSIEYEEEYMVYSVPNEKLARANTNLIMLDLPTFAHGFVFAQLRCLMDPILRHAMGYEDPSDFQFAIFRQLVSLRRCIIRHVCLPRPKWWTNPLIPDKADPRTGRFCLPSYLAHPYYVKPTFYSRWGPSAMYSRLIGGCLPGDEDDKYYPNGYVISEVGPEGQIGKGKEHMDTTRERISKARGCPMAFGV